MLQKLNDDMALYLMKNSKAVDPYEFKLSLVLAQAYDFEADQVQMSIRQIEEATGFSRRKIAGMISKMQDWKTVERPGHPSIFRRRFDETK